MKTFLALLGVIGTIAVLTLAADRTLPPELIEQRVYPHTIQGNKAVYVTCCTGGGTGSCKLQSPPPSDLGNAILIRRSRLLGRCTVEPLGREVAPCKCS